MRNIIYGISDFFFFFFWSKFIRWSVELKFFSDPRRRLHDDIRISFPRTCGIERARSVRGRENKNEFRWKNDRQRMVLVLKIRRLTRLRNCPVDVQTFDCRVYTTCPRRHRVINISFLLRHKKNRNQIKRKREIKK